MMPPAGIRVSGIISAGATDATEGTPYIVFPFAVDAAGAEDSEPPATGISLNAPPAVLFSGRGPRIIPEGGPPGLGLFAMMPQRKSCQANLTGPLWEPQKTAQQ